MLPEPLFSYPSDNVHMCTFQGTDDGRIFLGGKDGSIYEFTYQVRNFFTYTFYWFTYYGC